MGLSDEEFSALFPRVKREALHLNMRDSYGTETELPHIARWRAGESDDFGWLEPWFALMRESAAAGKLFRRVDIASEPLSEYQQWLLSIQRPIAEAGQAIRRVSRRVVSELLFPGNDFWLFDDELVVFMHYAGSGLNVAYSPSTDREVIQRCRDSFEAVWPLGVPYSQYRPGA